MRCHRRVVHDGRHRIRRVDILEDPAADIAAGHDAPETVILIRYDSDLKAAFVDDL